MSEERSWLGDIADSVSEYLERAALPGMPDYASGDDLAQSKYDFRYSVFPDDLGMDNNGHYMVININVPTQFSLAQASSGLALGKPAGAFTSYFTPLNQVSKVDVLRYGRNVTGGVQAPTGLNIPRFTRRIAESIALHMPSPVVFNQHNVYEEISLTALAGKLGVGAARLTGLAADKMFGYGQIWSSLGKAAARTATAAGDAISTTSSILQSPINPMVEILFTNTPQRQFTFEVLMAPRNEKESQTIRNIVQTLRFHATPELNDMTLNGLFWIPPADFDITFFNKGQENMNLIRINTCVMERIEVDYAPTGVYSTFRNGHPVAVRLSMAFRELEPLHKQRILQGF